MLMEKPVTFEQFRVLCEAFYCQNKVLRRFRDSQAAMHLFSFDEAPIKPVHR